MGDQEELNKVASEQGGKGKVELDPEVYNSLLDRVAELEGAALGPKPKAKEDTVDDLYEEGTRQKGGGGGGQQVNLDDMSNTELFQYIMEIGDHNFREVNVAIETIKLLRDIDRVSSKYDDFSEYEDEIREIALRNPTLSIEKAYKLAKAENPEKGLKKKDPGVEHRSHTQRILNLPPRVIGEKPSEVAGGATRDASGPKKSLRTAAEEAWDEVIGKGKE